MKMISVKEFASRMSVHPSTILRSIHYGRIHACRVGPGKKASWRISESEIERMQVFDATQMIENRAKELLWEKEKKSENLGKFP